MNCTKYTVLIGLAWILSSFTDPSKFVLIKNVGVNELEIGTLTIDDFRKVHGKEDAKIKLKSFRGTCHRKTAFQKVIGVFRSKVFSKVAYYSSLDLRVYYNDDRLITGFIIKENSPAVTQKGIKVNSSTMQKVLELYGKEEVFSLVNSDFLRVDYEGMTFECLHKDALTIEDWRDHDLSDYIVKNIWVYKGTSHFFVLT